MKTNYTDAAEIVRLLNEQLPSPLRASAGAMRGGDHVVVVTDTSPGGKNCAMMRHRRVETMGSFKSGPHSGRGRRERVVADVIRGLRQTVYDDLF